MNPACQTTPLLLCRQEFEIHRESVSGCDDISNQYLDVFIPKFLETSGLSNVQWTENENNLRKELRKARRDQLRASLKAAEQLGHYSFTRDGQDWLAGIDT